MARHRQDADENTITEADATAGAATFGGDSIRGTRQVTQSSIPADHMRALESTTFGPNWFEVTELLAVAAACKINAKDTGDLLPLLAWIFKELGPPTCGLSCSLVLLSGHTEIQLKLL
jgi:hypothetical protein